MDPQRLRPSLSTVLELAAGQHGVVTRAQLLELGMGPDAIQHRLRRGRLFAVQRGVYALGRPELSRLGVWKAAVLACGPRAVLSHTTAAALLGIARDARGAVQVTVPTTTCRRRPGIVVHRRVLAPGDVTERHGIPITTPACTLIDLAAHLDRDALEAAIVAADQAGLTDPEELLAALDRLPGRRHGAPALRRTLDARTFTLTDSQLERRFLPIARRAGLPAPLTGSQLNGFKVDFHWPELGLVVETDGLRYHRTPAQQATDRRRDQVHAAAGLTPLRFTHGQVAFEPAHVEWVLRTVARAAGGARRSRPGPLSLEDWTESRLRAPSQRSSGEHQ